MNDLVIGVRAANLENESGNWPARVRGLLYQVFERLVHAWGRQRQRQALAQLDERLLRDIGVSRAQARAESEKPFWES